MSSRLLFLAGLMSVGLASEVHAERAPEDHLIAATPHGWLARVWSHRKFRLFLIVAGIGLAGVVAYRLARRIVKRAGASRPEGAGAG